MDAAEIDRELDELGGKVEQLRALYEQYFMGFERTEPLAQRKDLERRVKTLRREQLRNTAQRFKLNTLVQRINTMQQHWTRVARAIENGTYRRDVIRAAARFGEEALAVLGQKTTREAAAAVARAHAESSHDGASGSHPRPKPQAPAEPFELAADDLIDDDTPTPPKRERFVTMDPPAGRGLGQGDLPVVGAIGLPPQPPVPTARPIDRAAAFGELDLDFAAPASAGPPALSRPALAAPVPRAPSPSSPGSGIPEQRMRQIYAQYVQTKRATQESTAGVTFEKLAASLRAQTDRLKSVHPHKSVDYEVVVMDGKTHLRPVLR
jgi:hypothetical protein